MEGRVEFSKTATVEEGKSDYDEFLSCEEVILLKKDFQIIEEFLEQLKVKDMEEDGWKKFVDKDTQKIYYQQEPGVPSLTIYLEEVINAPLINLFAILGEV